MLFPEQAYFFFILKKYLFFMQIYIQKIGIKSFKNGLTANVTFASDFKYKMEMNDTKIQFC